MDVLLQHRQKCAVCFVPDRGESAGGPVLVVVSSRRGGRHHAEDMINRGERLRPPQSASSRGERLARAQFQPQLATPPGRSAGAAATPGPARHPFWEGGGVLFAATGNATHLGRYRCSQAQSLLNDHGLDVD